MRAAGMQVLTDQIKARRPGVTIYGIGDEEHQQHTSGHNEDDTPGVSAEDQDADTKPEHRAIDVMVSGPFTQRDGDGLVQALVSDPKNQARMIYINWGTRQWHRRNGWKPADNSKDPHRHVHISGEADADENVTPWNLSSWDRIQEDFMFVQVTGRDEIYVPRGDGYVHLTSGAALAGALAVGYQIIQVPTLADVEALLGPKWEPAPPPVFDEDQLRLIMREEIVKTRLS